MTLGTQECHDPLSRTLTMPETFKDMPTPFIHRASVAASTLKKLCENMPFPYVKVVAGVSLLILETVQTVRRNRDQCIALVEQIDVLLCIVIDLGFASAPGFNGEICRNATEDRGLHAKPARHGPSEALFQTAGQYNSAGGVQPGLRQALDTFSLKTSLAVIGDIVKMRDDTEHKHQELLKLIAEPSLSDQSSDSSFISSAAASSLKSSLSSLSVLLPSAPQIFHGREPELQELIALLLQDSARVAILGPGGIGKTSLAKSMLHDPDITAKYHDRWFVSCDSAGTVEELAFAIGSVLGLELSGKLSKKVVKHLTTRSNCLLVLDNFETPWEPAATRSKVEEFLSVLADLPHVTLVVTMRGQERPEKIRWTRPFIAPLEPLHYDAAHKIFIDIADADSDEEAADVAKLLSLTGNLPLAVTLMATVASFDGCASLMARWKTDNISLLSDGFDKMTNLETSLRLSLSSPRISCSPGALQLLSLLSLLPDGITDTDLFNSSCPISNIRQAKSTLLRTSLAYVDGARLKVLAPVRELIRKLHPPPYAIVRQLRLHWDHFLMLWRTYQMPSGDLMQRLAANTGNVTSVLEYALDVDVPDLFFGHHSPLMENIVSRIERVDDNQLRGYHIWYLFNSHKPIAPSKAPEMLARGCRFFQLAEDIMGESRLQHTLSQYYVRSGEIGQAFIHAQTALLLAEQANKDLQRYHALCQMASCKRLQGKSWEALGLALRAQWLARRMGDFRAETFALEEEAFAWIDVGNFSKAVEICIRAQQLNIAGGLEGTIYEIQVLDLEADIHFIKTAYAESRRAHNQLMKLSSSQKSPLFYGNSLMSIASIDVTLGAFKSEAEVVAALQLPRQLFTSHGYTRGLPKCDLVVADFFILSGHTKEAVTIYEKCASSFCGEDADFFSSRIRKLGDITLRNDVRSTTHWAMACLAYGKSTANPSTIGWALRLLGDIFLKAGDDETSSTLFQVALEEFTRMDIYLGKAQSLRRLAEIAERRGECTVAAEQLSEARCMFLKSGLVGEAERIPLPVMVTEANIPGGTPITEIVPEIEGTIIGRVGAILLPA
ncbi:hypothetical protein C8R43DRAFT_1106678 [Mycena crocata]|nr:hypothetical protein C8R43DRAFT_1106678 [Mycena crocata]